MKTHLNRLQDGQLKITIIALWGPLTSSLNIYREHIMQIVGILAISTGKGK
jgi:hypothetical protein